MSVQAARRTAAPPERVRVLLIEDDDGDALLVEELLLDAGAPFILSRAQVAGRGRRSRCTASAACCWTWSCPTRAGCRASGGCRRAGPTSPWSCSPGIADEHLGEEAVAAGAQDYLVKGQVDGFLLQRVVRYAVERRRAEETQRQLARRASTRAENSRLERGLLPSPLLTDRRLTVAARYRSGGQQMLLGGDFYDVVEAPDGWVHAHGRRRLRSRAGRGRAGGLPARRVADHGAGRAADGRDPVRASSRCSSTSGSTTGCSPRSACCRSRLTARTAGCTWPGTRSRCCITADAVQRAAGARRPCRRASRHATDWPSAEVALGDGWSVLMYTDGLIEGKVGSGPERLGSDG